MDDRGWTRRVVRIEENLTASQYVGILENSLVPSLQILFGETEMFFVQDKSPIHMARFTKDWLAQQRHVRIIDWPATAADINPIENLWADLETR